MAHSLIELHRDAAEPLYRQLRNAIERSIAVGSLRPSDRLPSSRELAAELDISRNTVNLAYQELVAEGFIESRERSGLYVNAELRAARAPTEKPLHSTIEWSKRIRSFPDAHVEHIEKHANWYDYPYPFVPGQIDHRSFPTRAWLRCLRDAMDAPHAQNSLQDYGDTDDPMLVDNIRRHLLPSRGINARPEQILITLGSQQGLDLLSRLLLGPGSVVGLEDPGYLDARHIFLRHDAEIRGIPVDGSGLQPPTTLQGTDLLYVTPSHHHPTNVTLTIGRRHALLEAAAEAGTVIVEDDYDSEFRYQGRPTPALKAIDRSGDVVYLGTFSKFLSPGLRIGYVVAPEPLIEQMRHTRRYINRHPPGHLQRALALLIASGDYQRSVRRYRGHLMHKWEATRDALNAQMPWRIDPPPGGVSFWVTGPPQLDCRELVRRAEAAGVLIERGDIFFLGQDRPLNHFRLGFAAIAQRSIEPGIGELGRVVADLLSERS